MFEHSGNNRAQSKYVTYLNPKIQKILITKDSVLDI